MHARWLPFVLAILVPACAASEGAGDADGATKTEELNSACAAAHIASLKITKLEDDTENVDVCAKGSASTAAAAKPDVAAAIRSIKEINEKAAALFQVDAKQLFGAGIRIKIQTSEMGFNGQFETHDEDEDLPLVTVETVTQPQNLLNRGVYAHELGHWLLWVPGDKMPIALRSLGQSHFWGESIADVIALAIEGTVTSPEPGIPQCLESRSAQQLANRSYRGPNGFFLNRFQRSESFACCEQIANKPDMSKAILWCEGQEELEQSSPFDPTIPFDKTPFPVAEAAGKLREYSKYQLGIPVTSFLLQARDEIEPTILARFLTAAKTVPTIEYACKTGNLGAIGNVQATVASVREQLALVKKTLSPEQQSKLDKLAAAHGLEALDVLEPAELDLRARGLATNVLLIDGAPGKGQKLPIEHECVLPLQFSEMSATFERDEKCAVTCTRQSL